MDRNELIRKMKEYLLNLEERQEYAGANYTCFECRAIWKKTPIQHKKDCELGKLCDAIRGK